MGILVLMILLVGSLTFASTFLLFKKSKPNPLNSLLFWLTVIIATPAILAGTIAIWFSISSSYPKRSFDQEAWANKRDYRYEYVDDLVDHQKVIGLTKVEVKDMFGEPDNENDSTLVYYLGYCPKYFMNMDPDWLELDFNNGIAHDARFVP